MNILLGLLVVALSTSYAFGLNATYGLVETHAGKTFFDGFDFYNGADPTHGYVYFTTQEQASQWGLISSTADNAPVYMGADHTSVSSGSGRASVRIGTKRSYNSGLFILDLLHMPVGCGTWPAWWSFGPNWPNSGEIDIIEGVNTQNYDQSTLHTNAGCDMGSEDKSRFSGKLVVNSCEGNVGCGIQSQGANFYGDGFNNNKGGVYAMEWTGDHIQMFFFPRNSIPGDITNNNPNPGSWGKPYAYFQLGGNCPNNHFQNHNIIFDLTFCGDWAGSVFGAQCPGKGDCNSYVQNNPGAFANAYWLINYMKVFQ